MKTQEEYALEIDEIVSRDVESRQRKVVWIGFLGVLAMKISMYVSRYLSINHNKKSRK